MPVNSLLSAGVGVFESQYGYVPQALSSFDTVYMFGTGTIGPKNTPTLVLNSTDFSNQFGTSTSKSSVRLFKRNAQNGLIYFINVGLTEKQSATLVATPVTGSYSLTINGAAVAVNAVVPGDTNQTIMDKLVAAIDASTIVSPQVSVVEIDYTNRRLVLASRLPQPTALTVTSANANVVVAPATGTVVGAADYINAIENTISDELQPGFLIAPQAFLELASAIDRKRVYVALENRAADLDFMAIADCAPKSRNATPAQIIAEGITYTSTIGHAAYYGPYVVGLEGESVPASAGVAGVALRAYKTEGYGRNPAGVSLAMRGVTGLDMVINRLYSDVATPQNINLLRAMDGYGVVVFGARTRSASAFYRYFNIRIIFNVLNNTLRRAFVPEIFSIIDGPGLLLIRLKNTATQIGMQLWKENALYGKTPQDAFEIIISQENNPDSQLEQGVLKMDFYGVPAPTLEKMLIFTHRTTIGSIRELSLTGEIPDVAEGAEETGGEGAQAPGPTT